MGPVMIVYAHSALLMQWKGSNALSPVEARRFAKASYCLKRCSASFGGLQLRGFVRAGWANGDSLSNCSLHCIVDILLIAHVLDVALLSEAPFLKRWQRLGLFGLDYI